MERVLTAATLVLGLWAAAPAPAETLADVFENNAPVRLVSGLRGGFAEGPLWLPDGFLLFTDYNDNKIYRWDPASGRAEVYREDSGGANGLALDVQGGVIACEMGRRRVVRLAAQGSDTCLTEAYEGLPYNSPNDAIVDACGRIYFTDPDWHLHGRTPNMGGVFGLYRVDPDGAVRRLLAGRPKPNGLALSPDGSRLYVAYDASSQVMAYTVGADGALSGERPFGPVMPIPDGLKVDAAGRVFVATAEGVAVLSAEGERIGVVPMPNVGSDAAPDPLASNCAFGGIDGRTLFVTARASVFSLRLRGPGLAVPRTRDCAAGTEAASGR